MTRLSSRLRDDLLTIWTAGVDAVRAPRLMREAIQVDASCLTICGESLPWKDLDRILVVGAGKAGAGMASGLEERLGPDIVAQRVTGWVNVPADCVRPLQRIHLHAGRPAGVNEPTEAGLQGAEQILRLVESAGPRDLCLVLLSGGGSALLPAPRPGITLADKQAVTRQLMTSGATINEMNAVRTHLSLIKGGGLARACQAGRLVTLIISDVVGDPLDVIASGPTCPNVATSQDALDLLEKFQVRPPLVSESVFDVLRRSVNAPVADTISVPVRNVVIGSNAIALKAAARRAEELGYVVESLGSENQGEATSAGIALTELCRERLQTLEPGKSLCVLSGGEPIVHLPPAEQRGRGGRNQQLALAGLLTLWNDNCPGIALLSGGTDGEDGPTDAAGACWDAELIKLAHTSGLDPGMFLSRCDAYSFFEPLGGLIKTGPTHTNVMDLRVALVQG